MGVLVFFFFFKQKTAYEIVDCDWEFRRVLFRSFRLEARDEENSNSAFQYIQVSGFPRRKLSCVVACENQNGTTFYEDRNDFVFQMRYGDNGKFLSSEINPYDQQLWFIPKDQKYILAQDLRENKNVFRQNFQSSMSSLFSSTKMADRALYLSLKSGELQAYNHVFQDIYTYLSPEQKQLGAIAIGKRYILQEGAFSSGSNREVKVLFRSNGNVRRSFPIQNAIADMFFMEDNKALLFQNNSQGGLIQELNVDAGGGVSRLLTYRDSIISVLPISVSEYLISTTKKVLVFNSKSGQLDDFLNRERTVLAFDSLNRQLYVAEKRKLYQYSYPSRALIRTATLPATVKAVHLRFNY